MPQQAAVRAHLRIHGYVQGVNFRWQAQRQASALGLSGWVRNRPDGSVEAVAQGEEPAVHEFIDWTRRGPAAADVRQVDVEWEPCDASLNSFQIIA